MTAAALTACIAIGAIGCGGSKQPKSTAASHATNAGTPTTAAATIPSGPSAPEPVSGKPLSRKEFVAQAESLCKQVNVLRTKLNFGTQADIASTMPRLAVYEQNVNNRLAQLIPPRAISPDWHRFLAYARDLATDTQKYGELAARGDTKDEVALLQTARELQTPLAGIARRYRMRQCSDL